MTKFTLTALLILSCFSSAQAQISKNFRISCETPTVGVHIWAEKSKVYLKFLNPQGYDSFPVFDGTLTPGVLSQLKYAVEDLIELGDGVLVSWDSNKCRYDAKRPLLMECHGEGKIESPATELKTFTLDTYLEHQETLSSNYDVYKINWVVTTKSLSHLVTFSFQKSYCRQSF